MPLPKRLYVAIFLDEASKELLLKTFPPKHVNVYGEHMTLAFGRHMEPEYPVGGEFELEVVAAYEDDRGQAVLVKGVGSNIDKYVWVDQLPHITISCAVGIKPVYSNEVIKMPNPFFVYGVLGEGLKLKGVLDYFPRTPKEVVNEQQEQKREATEGAISP